LGWFSFGWFDYWRGCWFDLCGGWFNWGGSRFGDGWLDDGGSWLNLGGLLACGNDNCQQ
jgi:hypothetical protein